MTPSQTSEGEDPEYAVAVGARLRAVSRQKRLSLQAVEKASQAGVQGLGARRLRAG